MEAIPGVLFLAFFIWAYVVVIRKAGYSGWWVLIMIVPIVNLIMIWVFAFADWPALRAAKGEASQTGTPPPSDAGMAPRP